MLAAQKLARARLTLARNRFWNRVMLVLACLGLLDVVFVYKRKKKKKKKAIAMLFQV